MSTVAAVVATALWAALVVALSAWRGPTRRIVKRLQRAERKTAAEKYSGQFN